MPKTTGDAFPDGDVGDLCGRLKRTYKTGIARIRRTVRRRHLKQVLFLSGIFLLSAASVYALSPRGIGPSEHFAGGPVSHDQSDGKHALCVLYLDHERLASFGSGMPINPGNRSSVLDTCRQILEDETTLRSDEPNALEGEIRTLVSGYPIEAMASSIATYDREVAGLIVGIAKKESDWGNHVPTLGGQDCFNYWGYKGGGSRGTAMGYACFGSPEEAVKAIGDRIVRLVASNKSSGPEDMLVWKCGSSCAGHSAESVRSWVASVRMYYDRIVKG